MTLVCYSRTINKNGAGVVEGIPSTSPLGN